MISIIAELCPEETGGSVSTLPGSFKEFQADEALIFENLYKSALHIQSLSEQTGKDLHLGLEPEPLGHFENTEETLAFFQRFHNWADSKCLPTDCIKNHVGVNYDTCHFALEFDDCYSSLNAFKEAGIRISKIHLSNALEISPADPLALEAIRVFDEPTYLHQFMLQNSSGEISRHRDLPEFFSSSQTIREGDTARIHFHIPLYQSPEPPLRSTDFHAIDALTYLREHPSCCTHVEMETYTWGVLPHTMQKSLTEQLLAEYSWVLSHQ